MMPRLSERRLRHAVQLEASASRSDGHSCTSVVTDLSLDGCCLAGRFKIGEFVDLRIRPIGCFRGQVRWASAGRAGVRFIKRESGQQSSLGLQRDAMGVATIEYALIMALIAVTMLLALRGLGQGVENNWNNVDIAVGSGTTFNTN